MNEEEIIWCLRVINGLINSLKTLSHCTSTQKFNKDYAEIIEIRSHFIYRLKYVRFQESKGFDSLVGNRFENYWVPGKSCN